MATHPEREQKFSRDDWLALLVVLLVAVVVLTRQLMNDSLRYSDADRILMDGVFLHDFLQDLPLTRIYDYTINYFAQYPGLSIVYRPPFFPFIESLFNTVLGVNMWSSRLALLAIALVGLSAWFSLVRRIYDLPTAFAACLLFITLPFIAQWGWYTMAELPIVSMTMLAGYLFYRFTETERNQYLYFSAIAFTLTVWTKQTALYLAFWMILFLSMQGSFLHYLRNKHLWIAGGLVIAALVPLAIITIWLGDQNLRQSIGAAEGVNSWQTRAARFWELPSHLVNYQLTLPVLVSSGLGIVGAVVTRDRRALYFGLLILVTLAFFAYVVIKSERYTIFWLPAFAVFAALPITYLRRSRGLSVGLAVILVVVITYHIHQIYSRNPQYATGYSTAAAFVLDNSRSPVVFIDAYNNGYFTYFMRSLDSTRSMYVLRADKLLTSSTVSAKNRLQIHVEATEGIERIFNEYGVDLIVVEREHPWLIPIHLKLRAYLSDGPFDLIAVIPVRSNHHYLAGQELLIYRYLEMAPPTADTLKLPVPLVGKTIEVPWKVSKSD